MSEMAARIAAQLADKKTAAEVAKQRINYQLKNEERRLAGADARNSIMEARRQEQEKRQAAQGKEQGNGVAQSKQTQQEQQRFEQAAQLPMVADPGGNGNVGSNLTASSGGAGNIAAIISNFTGGGSAAQTAQIPASQPAGSGAGGAQGAQAPPPMGTSIQQAPGSQLPPPVPGGQWNRQARTVPGRDLRTGNPAGDVITWGLNKAISAMGGPEHFIGSETQTYVTDTLVKDQAAVDSTAAELTEIQIEHGRNMHRAGKTITKPSDYDVEKGRRDPASISALAKKTDAALGRAGIYRKEAIQKAGTLKRFHDRQRNQAAVQAYQEFSSKYPSSPGGREGARLMAEAVKWQDPEMAAEAIQTAVPLTVEMAELGMVATRAGIDQTRASIRLTGAREGEVLQRASITAERHGTIGAYEMGAGLEARAGMDQLRVAGAQQAIKQDREAHVQKLKMDRIAEKRNALRYIEETVTSKDRVATSAERAQMARLQTDIASIERTMKKADMLTQPERVVRELEGADVSITGGKISNARQGLGLGADPEDIRQRQAAGKMSLEGQGLELAALPKDIQVRQDYERLRNKGAYLDVVEGGFKAKDSKARWEDIARQRRATTTIVESTAEHAPTRDANITMAGEVGLAIDVERAKGAAADNLYNSVFRDRITALEIARGEQALVSSMNAEERAAISMVREMEMMDFQVADTARKIQEGSAKFAMAREKHGVQMRNAEKRGDKLALETEKLRYDAERRALIKGESGKVWSKRLGINGSQTTIDKATGQPISKLSSNQLNTSTMRFLGDRDQYAAMAWPLVGAWMDRGMIFDPGVPGFFGDEAVTHPISPTAATDAIYSINYRGEEITPREYNKHAAVIGKMVDAGLAKKQFILADDGGPITDPLTGEPIIGSDGGAPFRVIPTASNDPFKKGISTSLFQYADQVMPNLQE